MYMLLCIACLLQFTNSFEFEKQFDQFETKYEKQYSSEQERTKRFQIFHKNLEFIEKHNAGNHSWKLGMNQFGDLTQKEFAKRNNQFQSQKNKTSIQTNVKKPSCTEVDWVKQGAVLPVVNQGPCGSSPYYSATGAVAGRVAISGQPLYDLSIQEVIDCSGSFGNNGCEGGMMTFEFEYIMSKGGLCLDSDYPYQANDMKCRSSSLCKQRYGNITSYSKLPVADTKAFESALCDGPVATAVIASGSHFQLYKSGVFNETGCGDYPDHGILMVGFGTDPVFGDYWKLQNSWTSGWGEEGYIRLCRNCGMKTGECAVMLEGSYPIV